MSGISQIGKVAFAIIDEMENAACPECAARFLAIAERWFKNDAVKMMERLEKTSETDE